MKNTDDAVRGVVTEWKAEQKEKREYKKALKKEEWKTIERLKSEKRIEDAKQNATVLKPEEQRITSGYRTRFDKESIEGYL